MELIAADELSGGGAFWAVLIVLITAIVAPTWLSWWNSRQSKKELQTNHGRSFRDDFNKLVKTVNAQGSLQQKHHRMLLEQNDELAEIKTSQLEFKTDLSNVQKDHLLIGFELGLKALSQNTGETPVVEDEDDD